jgi:hypothetical protein
MVTGSKLWYRRTMDIPIDKPLVLVTWLDAKDGQTGWHSLDDIEKEKLATCYSVGWLMVRNNEKVIIMADYSEFEDDKEGGRHIAIPNGWVKSVTFLTDERLNERGTI